MRRDHQTAKRGIICTRRQQVQSYKVWFLALSFSLGYLQSPRAGFASGASDDSPDLLSAFGDYFRDWFKRVDETQAVQPHWKPPLFGTTPLLT